MEYSIKSRLYLIFRRTYVTAYVHHVLVRQLSVYCYGLIVITTQEIM